MFVDLHVHSIYSDGMLTPEQLVADAVKAKVSLLALADHDTFEGGDHMCRACASVGIDCIDAVEIDTFFKGEDLHILAYGFDPKNADFAAHVLHARKKLDQMTDDLIAVLQRQGKPVSQQAFWAYPKKNGAGGWKGLFYLQESLGLASYYEVFPLYDACGITYAKAGFSPVEETIVRIHEAGGIAVLAHPGDVSRMDERVHAAEMAIQLEELFAIGLDGAECYYPKHSPAETALFVAMCQRYGKLITSGSDCHGAFSGSPVGYMQKTRDELVLGSLLEKIRR